MSESLQSRTATHQAPLSTEFSRQEYWSGLTLLSLGDLPTPGIKRGSPALQADSLLSEPPNPLKILKSESLHKLLCQSWAIVRIQHKFPPPASSISSFIFFFLFFSCIFSVITISCSSSIICNSGQNDIPRSTVSTLAILQFPCLLWQERGEDRCEAPTPAQLQKHLCSEPTVQVLGGSAGKRNLATKCRLCLPHILLPVPTVIEGWELVVNLLNWAVEVFIDLLRNCF